MTSDAEKLLELVRQKRDEILALAARYGAHDVRLFGSVARGDATSESDIDFLVDFEPGRSLFDHGGLLMELAELLQRKVDVAAAEDLKPRIRERVLREARPLRGAMRSACATSWRPSNASSATPCAGGLPSMRTNSSRRGSFTTCRSSANSRLFPGEPGPGVDRSGAGRTRTRDGDHPAARRAPPAATHPVTAQPSILRKSKRCSLAPRGA